MYIDPPLPIAILLINETFYSKLINLVLIEYIDPPSYFAKFWKKYVF